MPPHLSPIRRSSKLNISRSVSHPDPQDLHNGYGCESSESEHRIFLTSYVPCKNKNIISEPNYSISRKTIVEIIRLAFHIIRAF